MYAHRSLAPGLSLYADCDPWSGGEPLRIAHTRILLLATSTDNVLNLL